MADFSRKCKNKQICLVKFCNSKQFHDVQKLTLHICMRENRHSQHADKTADQNSNGRLTLDLEHPQHKPTKPP